MFGEASMKQKFLEQAEKHLPKINETIITPAPESAILNKGDSIVIDLGNHYVGYFSFVMQKVKEYIDAPVRLVIRFCEVERELQDDYDDYKGWLSASWLQEEVVNVDFPGRYELSRRYAARYVRITVKYTPKPIELSAFNFKAVTSASTSDLIPHKINDPLMQRIDEVAVNTLKNCMQRMFEDGPKRDRRLWIGDLRLEALANYYTFNNYDIVKRCLYLFAATDRNSYGFMPGFLYEYPWYESGSWFLEDYSLLYVCSLCDYFEHSGDLETFLDLYETAKSIVDAAISTLDSDGFVTTPADGDVFIDWCEGLEKMTALHGVYLYTLDLWCTALARAKMFDVLPEYVTTLAEGRTNAVLKLFDHEKGAFKNARDNFQYSVHATVWMILGGVLDEEEGRKVLLNVLDSNESVKPFTPYMHHYALLALCKVGLFTEAEEYIKHIWGGMIELGADTFFEAYVPGDPDFSPYDDRKVNSMCHAWSCTPTYFIRKYGMGN